MVNIIIAGQASKVAELFGDGFEKVRNAHGGFIDIHTSAKSRILRGDADRTFVGIADTVLLTADSHHGRSPDSYGVGSHCQRLGEV